MTEQQLHDLALILTYEKLHSNATDIKIDNPNLSYEFIATFDSVLSELKKDNQ